ASSIRAAFKHDYEELLANMTHEQKGIFDEIMGALLQDTGGVFFIYGFGGTGKTFLWKTLCAALCSTGDIVLPVASSGIASLLLPGGRTAHTMFRIPLSPTESSMCEIRPADTSLNCFCNRDAKHETPAKSVSKNVSQFAYVEFFSPFLCSSQIHFTIEGYINAEVAILGTIMFPINLHSALSHWCISHRKKARQVVQTWEKLFNVSQKQQCVSFLYLANDIIQNSKKNGNEFVNEFWKVLPAALKHAYDNCAESGKKAATRLVNIWEERKIFGSRIQNLKDAIATNEVKEPASQVASNGKSANPIRIAKKDSQSLRIKLSVGGFPERIVSAFHSLHEEFPTEELALTKCDGAVLSAERIGKEVENSISQGIQLGSGTLDEIQEQEDVLEQCIRQLECAEATRVSLISLLKDALQEQVARRWINDIGSLRPKISSHHSHGAPTTSASALTEPVMMGDLTEPVLPLSQPISAPPVLMHPAHQPPGQPATSFASLAANDDESKRAAAAAVAAKLAASTSSAQMLTSVFSSLMAEQAAKVGFNGTFPPEKRPKLEVQSSGPDVSNPEGGSSSYFASVGPPSFPPPPPSLLLSSNPASNQFGQSAGMMLNMVPYGFGGSGQPPPPPPLPPSHLSMSHPCPPTQQSLPPLQPPLPPQNASGGYYRPPGIGLYGSTSQPSTPPVQRRS
ncbi:hypothetical protein KSS87_015531, partial [Heliosperma pusillum]